MLTVSVWFCILFIQCLIIFEVKLVHFTNNLIWQIFLFTPVCVFAESWCYFRETFCWLCELFPLETMWVSAFLFFFVYVVNITFLSFVIGQQLVNILCCRSPGCVFNIQAAQCQQNWKSLGRRVCIHLWCYFTQMEGNEWLSLFELFVEWLFFYYQYLLLWQHMEDVHLDLLVHPLGTLIRSIL